jgi:hypothetical protein
MSPLSRFLIVCVLLTGGVPVPPSIAQTQPAPETQSEKPAKTKRSRKTANDAGGSTAAPAPARTASDAEIQSAKAAGKVWVNTESGVYHKGGKWFGATKQGKFMAEQDAIKAGYRAAKNEK